MSTRRQFLQASLGSTAVVSLGAAAPGFLLRAASAAEGKGDGRILVVVQLSGGNDGLNTVVPYRNDDYRRARPTLAVAANEVHKLDGDLGLHPSLAGPARLLESGRLAVVQGVGYDQPNRSHFESMDIWHTCRRKNEPRTAGWLGRYLEQAAAMSDVGGLHLGAEKQPLALASRQVRVPSLKSLEEFQLKGAEGGVLKAVEQLTTGGQPDDDLLGFVRSSAASALSASQRVQAAAAAAKTQIAYPDTALATKLKTVGQLIRAGLQTRVFYVELDGFDTHSAQGAVHASLLRQWGDAVEAFQRDLQEQGAGDRVLTLTFSEFGRRVQENASQGTDHGAAAPVFLTGDAVQAGVHGEQPELTDLTDGDLKHHTDFRCVYATLLEKWLGAKSDEALGGRFAPLDVLG